MPVPGRYAVEIALMQEMNWSWPELVAAPVDLLDELAERMVARNKWQKEKDKMDKAKESQRQAAGKAIARSRR